MWKHEISADDRARWEYSRVIHFHEKIFLRFISSRFIFCFQILLCIKVQAPASRWKKRRKRMERMVKVDERLIKTTILWKIMLLVHICISQACLNDYLLNLHTHAHSCICSSRTNYNDELITRYCPTEIMKYLFSYGYGLRSTESAGDSFWHV
jgi:hypothetical protein